METDSDPEGWVGTVTSIQAQSADESIERKQSDGEDTVEEAITEQDLVVESKDVESDVAVSSQEESNGDERSDLAVHERQITLRREVEEDNETEKDVGEENEKPVAEIVNVTREETYVISKIAINSMREEHENFQGAGDGNIEDRYDAEKEVKESVEAEGHDEPDSTTGRVSPVEPRFKTPPRPTRVSVMPPTPPESGQGTPPQQVTVTYLLPRTFNFLLGTNCQHVNHFIHRYFYFSSMI